MGWPDLNEFDFRPLWFLNPLPELRYNVQYFSSLETLPPNLWDFYPTRSHKLGSCLVTSSSAMGALGSPSISRAPMGGGYAFRILITSKCRWQVQRQYAFVRLPEIHFTTSGFFLKFFNRLCVFSFFLFCGLHIMKSRKKPKQQTTT